VTIINGIAAIAATVIKIRKAAPVIVTKRQRSFHARNPASLGVTE
jgi:hypothetical protein